jgi:hypothetical protein
MKPKELNNVIMKTAKEWLNKEIATGELVKISISAGGFRILYEDLAFILEAFANQKPIDELEYNFRTGIANELSRQELIDRLCDYNEQNKLLRQELLDCDTYHPKVDWEKFEYEFYGFMAYRRDNNIETTDQDIVKWVKSKLK